MRGSNRLIEVIGIALLLVVLAVVGSRVSVEGDASANGASAGNSSDERASDVAGLVDRLRMAGLTVTVEGEAHEPQFSVAGQTLLVEGQTVEVFAYADDWSAEADAARIVSNDNGDGSGINDWIDTPHLFRADRLLVIHVGGSSQLNSVLNGLLRTSSNTQNVR